jgi:aminoglycoside/choline kinase family phosphotransferase
MDDGRGLDLVLDLKSVSAEESIQGDASTRCYSRGRTADGRSVIVCRYPDGDRSRLECDLEVFTWLRRRGLPVPEILGARPDHAWVVFEDLGSTDGARWLRASRSAERVRRAERLIEPLVTLSRIDDARLPGGHPPLDGPFLRWELSGFELWAIRYRLERLPPTQVTDYLDDLASRIDAHPRRVCHRDYHLDNLMIDQRGCVRVIDAQDLRRGPDTYDLASFLYERAAPELLTARNQDRVATAWAAAAQCPAGWPDRLLECRLQRGLKVVGTFIRLAAIRDPSYDNWVPPLAGELARQVRDDGAPTQLTELLLDLGVAGGNHARELRNC